MGMDLLEKNFAKLSLDRHFVDLVYMPILTAIALLGNIPTFYIFRYRSPSSVFSFNVQYLSLIYMVAIIIKLQLSIMILVNAEDGQFARACSVLCYVDMVTFVATGLQLLLTAVDRWRRIVHPEWELLNIRSVRTLSVMFMVTSLILNVPASMVFGRRLFYYKTTVGSSTIGLWQCFIRDRDNEKRLLLLYVTFILTCYFIFAGCFIAFFHAITREFAVGVQHQRTARNTSLVLQRSAQLFQAMAVTFLVCYFVYFVGLALRAAHTASDPFLFIVVKPVIDVLCYFNLMYLSSPPFIFFAASRRYRQEFKKLVTCVPIRKRKQWKQEVAFYRMSRKTHSAARVRHVR